jgi:hypothetical protein
VLEELSSKKDTPPKKTQNFKQEKEEKISHPTV